MRQFRSRPAMVERWKWDTRCVEHGNVVALVRSRTWQLTFPKALRCKTRTACQCGLEAKRPASDINEGDTIDEGALQIIARR